MYHHCHTPRVCFLIFAVMLTAIAAAGQQSTSIKNEQKRNNQQISQAQRNIKQNAAAVEKNLHQLELLEGEVADITREVRKLRGTSDSLYRLIKPLNDTIKELDANLAAMQSKYAGALRKSQTNGLEMNDLTFVLSSDSFMQAWQRYRSLRQFSRWRQRRSAEIVDTRSEIMQRRERLDSLKSLNAGVLAKVESRRSVMEKKRVETDRLVKSLKTQSRQLEQILKKRQQEAQRLEQRLEKALAAELKEQQEREERERKERELAEKAKTDKGKTEKVTADAANTDKTSQGTVKTVSSGTTKAQMEVLTGSFESNRGKLPFPVKGQATVVKKFGRQKHPRLPKVETDNPGIDIEASKGAAVYAVFDGEVSEIFKIPGFNNVIVLRHGDYVTVYANIDALDVKKGDKVKTGQQLGHLYIDKADNDRSVLHFELRLETEKKDPEMWLRR